MESVVRQAIVDKQGSADQKITAFLDERRGKGAGPPGTPPTALKPGGPKSPKDYTKLPDFDPNLRTGNTYRGKQICKQWADGRGCKFGNGCKFEHRCDVIINERGDVCGSTEHTRYQHVTATAGGSSRQPPPPPPGGADGQ